MSHFAITPLPLDVAPLRAQLLGAGAGAYASFEGWVRNHSEGQAVTGLYYEAYEALAVAEGQRILAAAMQRFPLQAAACVHRVGELGLGEMAVWVGVSAAHRGPAFEACRWIIDEVKAQVPIWKRERYASGDAGWLHPDAGRGGDPAG
jgi:molybdopterin synthase catalytic subunit